MFALIIGDHKYIELYREYLEALNIDLSNVIHPREFTPAVVDVYNHYLLKRADAVIVITENDSFNFYISKLCKRWYNIEEVISSINNSNNREVFSSIGITDLIDVSSYTKETLNMYLKKRSNKKCM